MPPPLVLLDIDCVLTDFVGAVAAEWGVPVVALLEAWTPGTYGCVPPLVAASGDETLTEERFWARLDRRERFWARMPILPWINDLVAAVNSRVGDDWELVSTPGPCPSSSAGKVEWVRHMFGPTLARDRLHLSPRKHRLAAPHHILIDDNEANCLAFQEAGGHTVLFPAHHNRWHSLKDDPLPAVLKTLDVFLEHVRTRR